MGGLQLILGWDLSTPWLLQMWLFVALKDMERMVTFEVTDYVVYLATNTSNGFGSSQYVGTAPAYVPDSLEWKSSHCHLYLTRT